MAQPSNPGLFGALKNAIEAERQKLGPTEPHPPGTVPVGKGGRAREQSIDAIVSAAAGGGSDSVAGDESNHSSTVASNAGPQAQSTDHYNNY